MKARGYLVRVPVTELDETFLGLEALLTSGADAVAGGISDVLQCTAVDHCRALATVVFGPTHTHLWLNGGRYVLPPCMSAVVAPPEVALEPASS